MPTDPKTGATVKRGHEGLLPDPISPEPSQPLVMADARGICHIVGWKSLLAALRSAAHPREYRRVAGWSGGLVRTAEPQKRREEQESVLHAWARRVGGVQ